MELDYYKALTSAEKEEVVTYASTIEWGFSPKSIREQFKLWKEGDLKTKAEVCYLLEDCNFHTLCRHLANYDEAAAVKWMDEEMPLEDQEEGNEKPKEVTTKDDGDKKPNASCMFTDFADEFREMARCIGATSVLEYGKNGSLPILPEYGKTRKELHKKLCELAASHCESEAIKYAKIAAKQQ